MSVWRCSPDGTSSGRHTQSLTASHGCLLLATNSASLSMLNPSVSSFHFPWHPTSPPTTTLQKSVTASHSFVAGANDDRRENSNRVWGHRWPSSSLQDQLSSYKHWGDAGRPLTHFQTKKRWINLQHLKCSISCCTCKFNLANISYQSFFFPPATTT